MMTRYEINHSTDTKIMNGVLIDSLAKQTMKDLHLKFFRSTKNRALDRKKAIEKYSSTVDLSQYAIHHCFNGLVGLVPRELHSSIGHHGYFYRLKASA